MLSDAHLTYAYAIVHKDQCVFVLLYLYMYEDMTLHFTEPYSTRNKNCLPNYNPNHNQ